MYDASDHSQLYEEIAVYKFKRGLGIQNAYSNRGIFYNIQYEQYEQ